MLTTYAGSLDLGYSKSPNQFQQKSSDDHVRCVGE